MVLWRSKNPDMGFISKIRKKTAEFRYRKRKNISIEGGMVSFTFDDIHDSAVSTGARILNEAGYKGTYYIAMGLCGMSDGGNKYFDEDQLRTLVGNGHEIGDHTHSHLHFLETDKETILKDLEKNEELLSGVVSQKLRNFSYPFGEVTSAAKRIVHDRFRSGRGITHGFNGKGTDLNDLRAVKLYSGLHDIQVIYSMIDDAVSRNAWLIFYTHDVRPDPSEFGCDPGYFELVVRYCQEKQVNVTPVTEALETIA